MNKERMQQPAGTLEKLEELERQLGNRPVAEGLQWLSEQWPERGVFSTSFGAEDQVITDIIASNEIPIDIFTLDTGRLFPETYATWAATLKKYELQITAYYPDAGALQAYVETNGPNAFYESVDLRKSCCGIRKVEPLKRALGQRPFWITGIRAEQSSNRSDMPLVEWDATHEVIKIHPLLHWTHDQVDAYGKEHQVPCNPLHAKGFVSIGCAPCTRAILPGEDFRAGRWWWEDADKKECGLHLTQTSPLRR
jgi:phosphoadenosine phosphosulfate reductase